MKITDFGIAWSASSVPLTQTGQVVGTAHYLSPEQAAGSKAGPASDVYALGMIGYECLAGRRAFDGDNSVQIALRQLRDTPDPLPDDVPENVRRLIGRALLKDPAARFADGAAFRDAVTDVLAGRMLTPPPVDGGTRSFAALGAAPVPRRRAARVLAPLAALLAGAGIALAGIALVPDDSPRPVAEAGPSALVLAAGDFVGRPVDEVEAELGELGLAVQRLAEETTDVAPGLVTGVTPAGAVRPGDTVTVGYAVAPAVEPAPEEPAAPAPAPGPLTEVAVSAPSDGEVAGSGAAEEGRPRPPTATATAGATARPTATAAATGTATATAGGTGRGGTAERGPCRRTGEACEDRRSLKPPGRTSTRGAAGRGAGRGPGERLRDRAVRRRSAHRLRGGLPGDADALPGDDPGPRDRRREPGLPGHHRPHARGHRGPAGLRGVPGEPERDRPGRRRRQGAGILRAGPRHRAHRHHGAAGVRHPGRPGWVRQALLEPDQHPRPGRRRRLPFRHPARRGHHRLRAGAARDRRRRPRPARDGVAPPRPRGGVRSACPWARAGRRP